MHGFILLRNEVVFELAQTQYFPSIIGMPVGLPDDMAFKPVEYQAIVIKAAMPEVLTSMGVEGQMADGKWVTLIPVASLNKLQRVNAGLLLPLSGEYGDTEFRRIRLNWKAAGSEPLVLERIAFYIL